MATCDCGSTTGRMKKLYRDQDGKAIESSWVCPSCRPDEFKEEPFWTPFERKIWQGHEAMPHMYRQRADGTLVAKDELIADTVELMSKPRDWAEQEQTEKIVEEKRKTRRTRPLEKWEVEQLDRAWRAQNDRA